VQEKKSLTRLNRMNRLNVGRGLFVIGVIIVFLSIQSMSSSSINQYVDMRVETKRVQLNATVPSQLVGLGFRTHILSINTSAPIHLTIEWDHVVQVSVTSDNFSDFEYEYPPWDVFWGDNMANITWTGVPAKVNITYRWWMHLHADLAIPRFVPTTLGLITLTSGIIMAVGGLGSSYCPLCTRARRGFSP
jgi:hypothetical protein